MPAGAKSGPRLPMVCPTARCTRAGRVGVAPMALGRDSRGVAAIPSDLLAAVRGRETP